MNILGLISQLIGIKTLRLTIMLCYVKQNVLRIKKIKNKNKNFVLSLSGFL